MKNDEPFGVVLIRDGHEAGPATTYSVGTLAKIVDFYQGSDGLLGVTAIGEQRFKIVGMERQSDGLNVGDVELIPNEEPFPLPAEYAAMPHILEKVLDDLGRLYESLDRRVDDAVWVTYRFAEILPIDLEEKQTSLESSDTEARLKIVSELLDSVRGPES